MGKVVFAELLDRKGNVRERFRVEVFPASIGRSYMSTVIVNDQFVCPEHLRLSVDSQDGILVEDLKTVNGTRIVSSQKRIEKHRIPPGKDAVLRIGQTVIRLCGDDFSVGPTVISRTSPGTTRRLLEHNGIASGIFIASFGINVLSFTFEIHKKVILPDLILMSLLFLVLVAVWSGFWSFLNRLVAHSFRFMTHMAIAGLASFVLLIFFTANEYFEFLFSMPAAAEVIGYVGSSIILSILLFSHLSVMSESSRLKRFLSSVLISTGLVAVVFTVVSIKRTEFSSELNFSPVMKPLGQRWVKAVSPDEFFGNLNKLKADIDDIAKEEGEKNR